MAKWQATCTCGDKTDIVETNSKEEAVDKIMDGMTDEWVAQHMAEKHAGQAIPSKEQQRAGLMSTAVEV